jgi:MFS family permease
VAFAAPFYVTLTAHSREFVPLERAGRVLTTLNLFALASAFGAQWLTGLLVALPGGDSLGTEPGFRLAFGFVVLMLLGAITIYYRAPERPLKRLAPTSDRQVR